MTAFRSGGVRKAAKSSSMNRHRFKKEISNDELKDNLNPGSPIYYSFSTLLCTPCSRSHEVGVCLGAPAGETPIRRLCTPTLSANPAAPPFDIVYKARS